MGSAAIQGEFWGKAARDWAELQEPLHRPLWEAMLNAANVGQGTRFLDAGCGGGGASVLARERSATVSGLDAAESLIRIARERVPNGDFHRGDIEDLPFTDGAFDVVIAANSIQFTSDPMAALRELRRVCASGGFVVVGLFSTPDKVAFSVLIKALRDALPEPLPGRSPFELSYPGVLEGLIEETGMKVLRSGEANCPFEYPNFDVFWQATVSAGPIQRALCSVAEEKLKVAIRSAVRPFQGTDGRIRIDNQYRYVICGHSF